MTYDPRDYVIYFPWDQYVITPEAQTVLQDAAKYASDGHATKEIVVGYTDTSGSVAYNLRLSERRAKATADALVALGVPQGHPGRQLEGQDRSGRSDSRWRQGAPEPPGHRAYRLLIARSEA